MARALTNEFSWKTATFMARLSYHCYAGEKEFIEEVGFDLGKKFYKKSKI